MDTIRRRKLLLFGHICRMSDDRAAWSKYFGWPHRVITKGHEEEEEEDCLQICLFIYLG